MSATATVSKARSLGRQLPMTHHSTRISFKNRPAECRAAHDSCSTFSSQARMRSREHEDTHTFRAAKDRLFASHPYSDGSYV